MQGALRRSGVGRWAFTTLAVLALALKIVIPPGFMVGSAAGAFPIVICTGHGAAMITLDAHGQPTKAPKEKTDHPCPFAGHGATPLTSTLPTAEVPRSPADFLSLDAKALDLFPGRGLAAPPPPSHAPPANLA